MGPQMTQRDETPVLRPEGNGTSHLTPDGDGTPNLTAERDGTPNLTPEGDEHPLQPCEGPALAEAGGLMVLGAQPPAVTVPL